MDFIPMLAAVAGLILLSVPLLGWARLSARLRRVEEQLQWELHHRESSSELTVSLTRRATALEEARAEPQKPSTAVFGPGISSAFAKTGMAGST